MHVDKNRQKPQWINMDQRNSELFHTLSEKYEPRMLDWLIGISENHKFVHFDNPKVASGTIKKTIAKTIDPAFDPVRVNSHDKNQSPLVWPTLLDDAELEYFLTSADIFRWVFVRHPTTRVLSAFLDKFVNKLPEIIKNASIEIIDRKTKAKHDDAVVYINTRKRVLELLGRDPDDWKSDISFSEFIDCLEKVDLKATNPHWRPQTKLIPFDALEIQAFRFESLDEDLARVLARIGGRQVHNVKSYATEASSKVHRYVTPQLEERIYALYQKDYEYLAYKPLLIT